MYIIDKPSNKISKLKQKTFNELNFKERDHLQEWIAKNPLCLGEELLIIQKEFSGFYETNERLDLLAIDKLGNLVVIENKLDDSGKDVTWQAVKYASYCSSLNKQDIIQIYQQYLGSSGSAVEKISEFFENKDISEILLNPGFNSQRIILVAANFRKEVTSTVLWLMNFKIRLQCFKVTPFELGEQLFLNIEQILPTKDTEEFVISIATKAQEEIDTQETNKNRHNVRIAFWEQFINENAKVNGLFANNSPVKENWLAKGIGMSSVNLAVVVSSNYCRAEITINRGNKEENKELFDYLYLMREEIENNFGEILVWERMDENITCRIKKQFDGLSYFEQDDWSQINKKLNDYSCRMEKAFRDPVKKLNQYWKQK